MPIETTATRNGASARTIRPVAVRSDDDLAAMAADMAWRPCLVLAAVALSAVCASAELVGSVDGPALQFRDEEYVLNSVVRVYRRERDEPDSVDYAWRTDNPASRGKRYIGRVRTVGHRALDEPVLYGVAAQPDKPTYEFCYCPLAPTAKSCDGRGRICHELDIAIAEQSGVLYFVAPASAPWTVHHYVRDFAPQRLELSVAAGDRKVFREVLVEPPAGVPDCSDYPDTDHDRYACLFLGEIMGPAPAPDEALLAGLPDKLVQPKANYELVFAEEFDGNGGSDPGGDCEGGLSNLDRDKWNFRENSCRNVDSNGTPCEDMRDGYYEMATFHGCSAGINTAGKFLYKYGYAETRYTVNLADSYPQNMNLVIGDPSRWLRFAAARYGVPLGNYREMSRALPLEINVFEYFPHKQRELTNYFYNYHPYIYYPHTEPRAASNWTRQCHDGSLTTNTNYFTAEQCAQRQSITVTKGLEWTPRGYRMLVKVQDLHDDYVVVSREETTIARRRARTSGGTTTYASGGTKYTGSSRNRFFEFLVSGDPDSVLAGFAVGHAPMELDFGSWRGFGNPGGPEQNPPTVRMRIEYVRVFQPADRYAGMEPVYE